MGDFKLIVGYPGPTQGWEPVPTSAANMTHSSSKHLHPNSYRMSSLSDYYHMENTDDLIKEYHLNTNKVNFLGEMLFNIKGKHLLILLTTQFVKGDLFQLQQVRKHDMYTLVKTGISSSTHYMLNESRNLLRIFSIPSTFFMLSF